MAIQDMKNESGTPDNPPSGYLRFYSEGASLKYKDSSGNVYTLSTGVTPEEVQDIVGAFISGSNGIDVTYDDGANTLDIEIAAATLALINSAIQPLDNISELTNDSGFQTASQVASSISNHEAASDPHPQYDTAAESQAKVDAHANLTNNPHSVTKAQVGLSSVPNIDATVRSNHTGTQPASTITGLATVATTGHYDDLNNKPTLVTSLNGLSDVDLTGLADGDYLRYNQTAGVFEVEGAVSGNFGAQFEYLTDDTQDSNGSSTYETYLTGTMYFDAGSTYRIGAGSVIAMSTTGSDWEGLLNIDGTTIGFMTEELKDAGTDQGMPRYMPFLYAPTTSGNKTVRLRYRPENGNGTAYIFYGIIEKWRVS